MGFSRLISARDFSPWENLLFKQEKLGLKLLTDNHALSVKLRNISNKKWDYFAIYQWLLAEHKDLSLSPQQITNLEKVKKGKAVFVITGQQPGLLGGPMYWLYKALTAQQAARKIEKDFSCSVVPVFWIAGDDSDLKECNHLELLEAKQAPYVFSLKQPDHEKLQPMSKRIFGAHQQEFLSQLSNILNKKSMEIVINAFKPEYSFTQSFKYIAQIFLKHYGVLFLDGYAHEFRKLSTHSMHKVISRSKEIESTLQETSVQLKMKGFKPIVNFQPGTVHAFILINGERHRLIKNDSGLTYWDRSGRWIPVAENNGAPITTFTHDVVSRPILIENTLPIAGHILGPNELGYFTQLAKVFKMFSPSEPLVYPRMTGTLLSQSCLMKFKNIGIPFSDVSKCKPSELRNCLKEKSWVEKNWDQSLSVIPFKKFLSKMEKIHTSLKFSSDHMYKYAILSLQKEMQKVWIKYINRMKNTTYQEAASSHKALFQELKWLANGTGQDRHLNILSLINLLGESKVHEIMRSFDPMEKNLQIIIYY